MVQTRSDVQRLPFFKHMQKYARLQNQNSSLFQEFVNKNQRLVGPRFPHFLHLQCKSQKHSVIHLVVGFMRRRLLLKVCQTVDWIFIIQHSEAITSADLYCHMVGGQTWSYWELWEVALNPLDVEQITKTRLIFKLFSTPFQKGSTIITANKRLCAVVVRS